MRNLKIGLRRLTRDRGFTATVVLTLALGIGANSAIFSVVHAALLRPLPYYQPERILTLGETRSHGPVAAIANTSYPDYMDWTQQAESFAQIAGYQGEQFVYADGENPEILEGGQVTANFFATLGVTPVFGRDFVAGEDRANRPNVALVSYPFWQQRLGSNPSAVGRVLRLDGESYTVVGILPKEFDFAPLDSPPVWVPINPIDGMTRRSLRWMHIVGRLRPRVSPSEAYSEMTMINARLAAEYPEQNSSVRIVTGTLRDRIVGQVEPLLLMLLEAVSFVLLTACANVVSLFLARGADRRKEIAVRQALGAGMRELIGPFLTDLLLSLAGGAFGLLWSQWGVGLMLAIIPQEEMASMPYLKSVQVDPTVIAFTLGAAMIVGLIFGVAPAFEMSSTDVSLGLRDQTRGGSGGAERSRLRSGIVVSEIAVALVLLTGAGLMVKSVRRLVRRDPGFDPRNLLTFAVGLPENSYKDEASAIQFAHPFTEKVRALPGVQDVAITSKLPLTGNGNTIRFVVENRPVEQGHEDECNIRDVSANYFRVMNVPLLAGRLLGTRDIAGSPPVIIVNQAFVKEYFQGQDPLGKRIRFTYSPKEPFREIVGVVGNENEGQLDEPVAPTLFPAFDQDPDSYMHFVVRTVSNPSSLVSAVREVLRSIDAELPLIEPAPMERIVAESPAVFLRKFPSFLIGSFAVLALALAMVGLYGLVSYSFSRRTREIGIRMALGAQRGDLLQLVFRQGSRLAIFGVAIGLLAAAGLTQLLSKLLFGVQPLDWATFLAAALALEAVAWVACLIPARRATRVDPIVALRYE